MSVKDGVIEKRIGEMTERRREEMERRDDLRGGRTMMKRERRDG